MIKSWKPFVLLRFQDFFNFNFWEVLFSGIIFLWRTILTRNARTDLYFISRADAYRDDYGER